MIALERGLLLVHRESRLVYAVHLVLPNGHVVLESDDDGSLQNDDVPEGDGTSEEVLRHYDVWRPGMMVRDRTGKGVFCREATGWKSFFGIPSAQIEEKVLRLHPTFSTGRLP